MKSLEGNRVLFGFLVRAFPLLRALPAPLINPDVLDARMATEEQFEVKASNAPRTAYFAQLDAAKAAMRALHSGSVPSFGAKMGVFFAVRLLSVLAALLAPLPVTVAVSCLQFVFLPYSLFVCVAELMVLFPALFLGHFVVYFPERWLLQWLAPGALAWTLTISPAFIAAFFAVDQLLCAWCVYRTPTCRSQPVTRRRLLQSVLFGFLNCKTYFLVLLLCLRGLQIPLAVWLLDAATQLSARFSRWFASIGLHWAALFYHQHCVAHIPVVYQDAHKFHHYLHDTTAFDAHIYGSGAPEELLCLYTELFPALLLGCPPPSLSFWTLYISWTNKVAHTRKSVEQGGCNFHADHHVYHSKNFGGFYAALDMYMGTAANNTLYQCGSHQVRVVDDGQSTTLSFTRHAEGGGGAAVPDANGAGKED